MTLYLAFSDICSLSESIVTFMKNVTRSYITKSFSMLFYYTTKGTNKYQKIQYIPLEI